MIQASDMDLVTVGFRPKLYLIKLRTGKLKSLDPAKAGKDVYFERKGNEKITIKEQL